MKIETQTQFLFEPINGPGYYAVWIPLWLIMLVAFVTATIAVLIATPLVATGFVGYRAVRRLKGGAVR